MMKTDTPRTDELEHEMGEGWGGAIEPLALCRELEIENVKLRELGNDLRHSCEQFGWTSAEHEYPRATKRIKAWDDFLSNV